MLAQHVKLNLDKLELLFLPGKACPLKDLSIKVDNYTVSPSLSAKNIGVTLNNTLSFSANIKQWPAAAIWEYLLYNFRIVQLYLAHEVAQVIIQVIVLCRLDYCNSLFAGLPACAIKPLQLIQNAAARVVFTLPISFLMSPRSSLPVEARIHYKTMVLTYGTTRGTDPLFLQAILKPYNPTRALHSATSGLLALPFLRVGCSCSAKSKLFSVLAHQWWNQLPPEAKTAEFLPIFQKHLKPFQTLS
ncbi:uncharacterized protein [Oncorhynchus clarkii lewisi]|uniref:uncharacterized protein n=1 Tax=Oncorhynchus clarkii lewisi TaxID=490388 RepID=UPI0039B8D5EA